jgi:1-deoxy-D-xylulose-5-phosphate reductoisomerase
MKKRIAILGSTGSIGVQALNVIRNHKELFEVEVLTAHSNYTRLIEQAIEFKPNTVVITQKEYYSKVQEALSKYDIKVFAGEDSMADVMEMTTIDIVLTAVVGFAGLKPTLRAIENGKTIALANKETMVVAGKLVTDLARERNVAILPVDSEHSAIFQCLAGETFNAIDRLLLTASGGPFFGKTLDYLKGVTVADALKHPNWVMGRKVTIDSATLMNKGLEVIEAKWLFNVRPEQIEVVVHPQSIVHSLVEFQDGSIKAQLGLPSMELPIQYAFSYPLRISSNLPKFNFANYSQLSFYEPDRKTFPCLDLAYTAMNRGGNMPCIMNAANEIAVQSFIEEKIAFVDIPNLIGNIMDNSGCFMENPTLEDLLKTDSEMRIKAQEWIDNKRN